MCLAVKKHVQCKLEIFVLNHMLHLDENMEW